MIASGGAFGVLRFPERLVTNRSTLEKLSLLGHVCAALEEELRSSAAYEAIKLREEIRALKQGITRLSIEAQVEIRGASARMRPN